MVADVHRYRGRALRHDQPVCGRIDLVIAHDDRVGLAPTQRRHATVRFLDPPTDRLRDDLATLLRRRGAAGRRAAERLEPIELVLDTDNGQQRLAGRLEPPLLRHGPLRDIEFGIRVWP